MRQSRSASFHFKIDAKKTVFHIDFFYLFVIFYEMFGLQYLKASADFLLEFKEVARGASTRGCRVLSTSSGLEVPVVSQTVIVLEWRPDGAGSNQC